MNNSIIIAGVFLVMGVACVLMPIQFLLKRKKMLQNGVRTIATVIDVLVGRIVSNETTGPTGLAKRKYTYTLEYMAGSALIAKKYTSESISQDYTVGDKVEIAYFPDKPESFMFGYNLTDSPLNKIFPVVFAALGAILFIVGVILFVRLIA